jgi:phage gp36-like protein
VATRYKPPLASVPELLKYLANDLAHFYLYQAEPPTWVQVRFDQARKMLREIQTGALPLGIDATGADATEAAGISDLPEMLGGAKVFGREFGRDAG